MKVIADLHNHSCLSPCASLEMSPRAMAARAKELGIGVLALTDHNSALNCPALADACAEAGIGFIPGIEVSSIEECHVVCLFPEVGAALEFGLAIERRLPRIAYDPEKMGDQVIVDVEDAVIGMVEHYLGMAVEMSLDEVAALATGIGGIAIPAHIDRRMFSVKSQLGFLPDGPWPAVETTHLPPDGIDPRSYPLIMDSDAHYLEGMGRRNTVYEFEEDWNEPGGTGAFRAFRQALSRGGFDYRVIPSR